MKDIHLESVMRADSWQLPSAEELQKRLEARQKAYEDAQNQVLDQVAEEKLEEGSEQVLRDLNTSREEVERAYA